MPVAANASVVVLDLDGALGTQAALSRYAAAHLPLQQWGRAIRLGCTWRRFRAFAAALDEMCASIGPAEPLITLYGSGDFHHVSLALLMRRASPCNLLVLDKHPDWMRGAPILHCGTWLRHAARLPQVRRVFHVGGDADFDNVYRWLAPRDLIKAGRIRVFPAVRRFDRGLWKYVRTSPMRESPDRLASADDLTRQLEPFADELSACALYISVDKDVLADTAAATNWDAGWLSTRELLTIIEVFLGMAGGKLAGADIVGDASPVQTRGWLPGLLKRVHSGRPGVDLPEATRLNEEVNVRILDCLRRSLRA